MPTGEVTLKRKKDQEFKTCPWRLEVRGVREKREDLLFEQFVWGGYILHQDSGIQVRVPAIVTLNVCSPRQYGQDGKVIRLPFDRARKDLWNLWVEDFYEARIITGFCEQGKKRMNEKTHQWGNDKKGRRVLVFEDTPGDPNKWKFGEIVQQTIPIYAKLGFFGPYKFIGFEWDCGFHHKIWIKGQEVAPYYEIKFFIKGGSGEKLAYTKLDSTNTDNPESWGLTKIKGKVPIPSLDIKVRFQHERAASLPRPRNPEPKRNLLPGNPRGTFRTPPGR